MSMRVIEVFHKGKKDKEELCEDLYVFNQHFVAVVDGATNVWDRTVGDKSPGRLAAEVIKEAIEQMDDEKCTLEKMIDHINGKLQKVYMEMEIFDEIKANRILAPTASLVVYSHYHREIWQIGDCQAMVDGRLYQHEKELDSITANARSLFLEAELKKGKTIEQLLVEDSGWEYIKPLIQQQYYLQNVGDSQYSFEVVDGFDIDLSKVKIVNVPNDAKEIILASDGYPYLKPSLEESEVQLSELMENDPLCFREYKCTKGMQQGNISFDDRVYVRFSCE